MVGSPITGPANAASADPAANAGSANYVVGEAQPGGGISVDRARTPLPRWLLGLGSLLLAVAAAVVQSVAIVQASSLEWRLGTILAWVSIGLAVAAVVLGILAIVLRRGRGLGIAAVVLGFLANPAVLVLLFGLLA